MANRNPKNQFTKANQPKANGRRKNELAEFQKKFKLSSDDINGLMDECFRMTLDEIKAYIEDSRGIFLKQCFAKAMLGDYLAGDLRWIDKMLDRRFGKAKISAEIQEKKVLDVAYLDDTDRDL